MNRQKELKQAYKEAPPLMGIYAIRNKTNGKLLLGKTTVLDKAWNRHEFQLRNNSHPNRQFQADWLKYGQDAFSYEILDTLKPESTPQAFWRDALAAMEKKWLDQLSPYGDKGYNEPKKEKVIR